MSVHDLAIDALLFAGGTLFYGFRAAIGKWAVKQVIRLIKKFYLDTDHELHVFLRAYTEAANRPKKR